MNLCGFSFQPLVLPQEPFLASIFSPLKVLVLVHHRSAVSVAPFTAVFSCSHLPFTVWTPELWAAHRCWSHVGSTPLLVSSRLSERGYSCPVPTCVDLQSLHGSSFLAPLLITLCLPCLIVWTTFYVPQVQPVLPLKCFLLKWAYPSKEFWSLCNCPHCCLSLRVVWKVCRQWCCNSRPLKKKILRNIIFNVSSFSFPCWSQTIHLLCLYPPLLQCLWYGFFRVTGQDMQFVFQILHLLHDPSGCDPGIFSVLWQK